MGGRRFDALVVGAGPAGSTAALVLARGGARVALVDKAAFPRDKACGDVVGPRGVQTLADLGLAPAGPKVADMEVVGPTGRVVRLPAVPGLTYPGYGLVAPRARFDAWLRQAALDAGAVPFKGRAAEPSVGADGLLDGFEVEVEKGSPLRLSADVLVGADGALSRVAAAAGLVNEGRVLWGFAARAYAVGEVRLPQIHFWEPARWSGYPGYGWVFPGAEGTLNVGLGVAARGDRRAAAAVSRDLPGFMASTGRSAAGRTLGGWLKMGMVGTLPAGGRTLLVGDAAGLVNSLQGEGIAQALASGRAAAEAVLSAGPGAAAGAYRQDLAARYAPFAASTATVVSWMLSRRPAVAAAARLLTAPGVGRVLAGPWSVFWNDLLDGCRPGWPARGAGLAEQVARLGTRRSADRRWLLAALGG